MSKKITKEDLQDDMFLTLSDQILNQVVKHQKIIGAFLAIVLIAGLGYVGFESYQNWNESKATKALYPLNREFTEKNQQLERKRLEAQKVGADKKDPKAALATPKADFQTEYGPVAEKMKKEIMAHAHTQAAKISAVELARVMMDNNQAQMAVDLLQPLVGTTTAKNVVMALLKSQLGAAYSHTGKFQEAISQYDAIVHNKDLAYLHPEAYIKEALCYEKLGQSEKARDLLQKVKLDYPGSQAANTAKLYARVLGSGSVAK